MQKDLRSDVIRLNSKDKVSLADKNRTYRTTHCLHSLLPGEVLREAEIDHLDTSRVVLAGEHEVLRLDVPVTNVLTMEVD